MIKHLFLTLTALLLSVFVFAQNISIKVKDKPLAEVFYQIRDDYQIQFTFNSKDIENCIITKNATYKNPDEAVADLINDFDLTYKKQGNVFIILPNKNKNTIIKPVQIYHHFSGTISDAKNGEILPSAVIKLKKGVLNTNSTGFFSFKLTDTIAKVKIHYLGYFVKDTVISASQNHNIKLYPAEIKIKKITIKSNPPVFDMHTGQEPANIKLNHKICRFLPGNIDNGIYNMLRLQPGIMASGEQSDDYTIWGSYQGQNLIQFDNIKLFNISSFDGNQSVIHPLMIKEIDIFKGGFNAQYGNMVGGVVDITGKNGDFNNFRGNANINNNAVSGYLNIPIADRFALQTAYRQTFYNIFEWDLKEKESEQNFYIPDISFRDFNMKFSAKTKQKDNFFINILASEDELEYDFIKNSKRFFSEKNKNTKYQVGASAEYNKFYKKGSFSSTVFSFSGLNYQNNFSQQFNNPDSTNQNFLINSSTSNNINEMKIKHTHHLTTKKFHKLSFSGELVRNSSKFLKDTNFFNLKEDNNYTNRIVFYAIDNIYLFKKLNIQAGLRADYVLNSDQIYIQPRINTSIDLSSKIKLNAAYGKYNQFITKRTVFDNYHTISSFWEVINTNELTATSANHYTLGASLNFSHIKLNIEGFFKTIDNIYAYRIDRTEKELMHITGNSIISGIDFYLETKFGKHELWAAYTLSQTLEHFNNFNTDDYKLAPHNQTHEIKGAAVLNFSPFYFSANYVYGSGLQFTQSLTFGNTIPYNRFDISAMYKITIKKVYCQFGLSVLNVFNTPNVKFNNTISVPGDKMKMIYSKSIPFTPQINIYVGF